MVVIAQIPSRKIIVIPTLAMIQEMLTVVETVRKKSQRQIIVIPKLAKIQKMLTVMETARQKTQNQIIVIPKLAKTQDLLIVMKSVGRTLGLNTSIVRENVRQITSKSLSVTTLVVIRKKRIFVMWTKTVNVGRQKLLIVEEFAMMHIYYQVFVQMPV